MKTRLDCRKGAPLRIIFILTGSEDDVAKKITIPLLIQYYYAPSA